MKVPVSWLREYVQVDASVEEIAARLTVSTCEVERIVRRGVPDGDGNLGLFRVGRVLEAEKHPNADRLQLCRVDVGESEAYQIVCGAWNFGAGAKVAVALPGATIAGGLQLERRELRGQMSEGMILAEDEVDLGEDHSGIMVLDPGLEPGTPLVDVLPILEDVLEVETTPNRPDLLSVYGLAREVAALFDGELADWPGTEPERAGDEEIDIRLDDLEGLPALHRAALPRRRDRAVAAVASGAPPPERDAPDLERRRRDELRHAGAREPAARLRLGHDPRRNRRPARGRRRARDDPRRRRTAARGERDLVIADHERAVALAAIMGGEETEISEGTTNVLLEAANFEPFGVYRTSERLVLRTEGSNRWEKGVDPHIAPHAARLATQLLVELSGARWVADRDEHGELPERPVVELRPERVSELIGLDVPAKEQAGILGRLGFEEHAGSVVVPTWRARDVTRQVDLVEEVARFRLDDVPFTLPERRELFARLETRSSSYAARSRTSSSDAGSSRRTRRASSRTIRIRPRSGSACR